MEPILTRYVREPNGFTLDFYLQHGGYEGLKKALGLTPDQVIDIVKKSGLPDRHEVAVRGQEVAQPEVHRLQRRRERAGDLQGPPPDGTHPASSDRRMR